MNNHCHTVIIEVSLWKIWTYKFKGRELSWRGAGRAWEGGSKCTNENSQFLKVVLIQVSLEYDAILSQWTGRASLCLCNKKLWCLFFPISSVSSSVYNLHLQECLVHFEKAEFWIYSLPLLLVFSFSSALATDLVKWAACTMVTIISPFAHYFLCDRAAVPLHYRNVFFSEITDGPVIKFNHQIPLGLQSPFLLCCILTPIIPMIPFPPHFLQTLYFWASVTWQ